MYSYDNKDLMLCRVCLSDGMKLFDISKHGIASKIAELSGVSVSHSDGLPQYLCSFCYALLWKSTNFRNKCTQSHAFLSSLLKQQCLTTAYVKTLNTLDLKHNLSTSDVIKTEIYPEIRENKLIVDFKEELNRETYDLELFDDKSSYSSESSKSKQKGEVEKITRNSTLRKVSEDNAYNNYDDISSQSYGTITVAENLFIESNTDEKDKERQDSKEERIKAFTSKYLNAADHDKNVFGFYQFILNRYVKKDESISFHTDGINSQSKSVLLTDSTSNLNENQKKLYQYIKERYKKDDTKGKTCKKVTDIARMRETSVSFSKSRQKQVRPYGLRTKEDMNAISKNYNVEIVLLDREQQIVDLMSRKERKRYKTAVYKCELCYRGFMKEKTFQNHMAIHDANTRPYECKLCHVRFGKRTALSHHETQKHKYKFICKLCNQVTRSTTCAREHYKNHEGCQYVCEHCGKVFRKYASRLDHIRKLHGTVKCDICQDEFVGANGLLVHKAKAHREVFKCESCGVQFHNLEALKQHKALSVDICGPHIRPCTQCGENFTDLELLNAHRLQYHSHKMERKYKPKLKITSEPKPNVKWLAKRKKSKDCDVSASETADPVRKRGSIMCEMCAADGFASEAVLRYHQRIHTGEKPHPCPHCEKRFRIKDQLEYHIRTHTGDRPYQCTQCLKSFKTPSALHRHQVVHSKTRRDRCHLCDKVFRTASCVKTHIKTVHLKHPAYTSKRVRRGPLVGWEDPSDMSQ